MEQSDSYRDVANAVQKAVIGKKGTRRDMKGRVLPKAAIRHLAAKAGLSRMAYGPKTSSKGYAEDPEKDTYGFIDQKVYTIMENIIYDAIAMTQAGKSSGKAKRRIIKERHMVKALARHGAIGLGSDEARRML